MSFPKYETYKESGVEWLGEVPDHWDTSKLKFLTKQIVDGAHFTPTYLDDGIPFLRVTDIQNASLDVDEFKFIPKNEHEELIKRCKPEKGDLLLSKNGTIGIPRIIDWDWEFSIFVSLCLIKFVTTLDSRYAYFFFLSHQIKEQINSQTKQSTVTNLHLDKIENFTFPLPSLDEQTQIARFLDHETTRIDALIAEQERLIELLKEKRQAVISHAVTKGLDPTAPMKDSGVEWLGEVPKHWDVMRLKYLVPEITVGIVVEPSKYYVDEGIPALRSLNVKPGKIIKENLVYISQESNELQAKSKIYAGDIVAVRSGQPGTAAVVSPELDGCNCIDLIIIRKPISGLADFLLWYLNSDAALEQFSEGTAGAIQQHFNISSAVNLVISWPSEKEQREITTYLASACNKLDTLIAEAETSKELLNERRSALISAAVTGKIDVRDWQAPTSASPAVL